MQSISRTPSIYQIRHVESGKVYVGSAIDPRGRCVHHRADLERGAHHSRHLQNAWSKYGESAFVFEIIEPVLFIEDLISREQYWIDRLQAFNGAHGYNTSPTAGSSLGVTATEETRARASKGQRARFADPEKLAKHSARQKEVLSMPAARAKMSVGQKARFTRPEEIAKSIAIATAQFADPVARAAHGAKMKECFANPEVKAILSAGQKARFSDPLERAKRAAIAKAQWSDPVYRAKYAATIAARKMKRDAGES